MNKRKQTEQRNWKPAAGCLAALLLAALLACLLARCGTAAAPPGRPAPPEPAASGAVLSEGEIAATPRAELEKKLDEIQKKSNFTVYVFPNGSIREGSRDLSLTVGNLKENTATCFFELLADGETVYTSPVLRPDERMDRMTLERPLTPGEHNGVVRYWLTYPDGGRATVEVETILTCR